MKNVILFTLWIMFVVLKNIKILFEHKMKLFFVIFCLFVEIPKKMLLSQKILIFTYEWYDPKKHKLWVKVCKLDPKLVLIRFKNVFGSCFWDLLQKKSKQKFFKIGQILIIFWKNWKKTRFFAVFFFDPPIFRPKTDKLPKKSCRPSELRKIITKKIYRTLWSKFTAEFKKIRPPYTPYKGGGVLLKSSTFKPLYFLWRL